MTQIAVIVSALLLSLAIVFHALSNRFEFVRIDDTAGFRIDRLNGKLTLCGVGGGTLKCFAVKEP